MGSRLIRPSLLRRSQRTRQPWLEARSIDRSHLSIVWDDLHLKWHIFATLAKGRKFGAYWACFRPQSQLMRRQSSLTSCVLWCSLRRFINHFSSVSRLQKLSLFQLSYFCLKTRKPPVAYSLMVPSCSYCAEILDCLCYQLLMIICHFFCHLASFRMISWPQAVKLSEMNCFSRHFPWWAVFVRPRIFFRDFRSWLDFAEVKEPILMALMWAISAPYSPLFDSFTFLFRSLCSSASGQGSLWHRLLENNFNEGLFMHLTANPQKTASIAQKMWLF